MELIRLLKRRKVKEAIKQVKDGESINESDENGCTALHYACSEGLLDFIVAAALHGVNFEQKDKDGESALFKAVQYSKLESIVALVAFKSNVNVKNKNQQSPLAIAVKKKDVAVIELLCNFGSLVTIDDWAISRVDVDVLNKTDQKIMQTLIKQFERVNGNDYGNHVFRVCYVGVSPDEHRTLSSDITLSMKNISSGFFIYCSKSIPEYTDYEMHIGSEDRMFSDVYEIKTWGHTPKHVSLNIAVLGFVKQNQVVSVMPFEGSVEGAMSSRELLTLENDEDTEDYTKFDIKIDLTRMKSAKFVVLVHQRHEEFDISQESLKIIPQSDSGAEINISEGTFECPGKLMLKIADTNYWNTDEMVLFTNALNIKMQSNIKPKKPVNIKLPLHSSIIQPDDLLIISSDKDIPETEDDWEICSTNVNIQGNTVTFDAEHFTSFDLVSKTNIKQSKNVLTKAVAQYKPTEMFAGIKRDIYNKVTLVVEIALKNRGKQRRKHWKKKGFALQATEYKESVIQDGEQLKISVKGNFEIDSIRRSGGEQLIFNPAKNSFRTFYIIPEDHEHYLGCIVVSRSTQNIAEHSVVKATKMKRKPGLFRLFYKNVVEVDTPIQVTIENATEELVSLPIDGQFLCNILFLLS